MEDLGEPDFGRAVLRGGLQALSVAVPVSAIVALVEVANYGATFEFEWRVVAIGASMPITFCPTLAFPLMVIAWHEEPMGDEFRIFRSETPRRQVSQSAVLGAAAVGLLLSYFLFALCPWAFAPG